MKYTLYIIGIILGIIFGLPILAWLLINLVGIGFTNPLLGIIILPWIIIVPGILIGLKIWNNKKIKELEAENQVLRQKLWTYESQRNNQ